MLTRAIYAVPILAVSVTVLVMIGPGAQKSAIGARVRGAPREGSRVLSLRIEAMRHLFGTEDSAGPIEMRVVAKRGEEVVGTWEGKASADGVAEARIEASSALRGLVHLRVERAGRVMAEGDIALGAASSTFVTLATLAGKLDGPIELRVDAARGVLAAPFPEVLRITATSGRPHLEITANGAEISPASIDVGENGVARVRIKPLSHDVELTIKAKAVDGSTGSWQGLLPIVPGAEWLKPESGLTTDATGTTATLLVVSPAPRERAYVSLWSEEGRVGGAVVEMTKDAEGFFQGSARVPAPSSSRLLFASIGSDPREQGGATVAWPLRPAEGAVQARPLDLMIDGMPLAIAREKERSSRARRLGTFVVAAAAVLEALLIIARARSAQRKLAEHLERAELEGSIDAGGHARLKEKRAGTFLWALVLIAVVALSFSIVAALATFRA